MKANEIIDLIITRHEENDSSPIHIHDELRLEPQLNYSGKMARQAYAGTYRWMPTWNGSKKYCGILDCKIMDTTGKMRHHELIKRTVEKIPIEALREIYDGQNPNTLGLEKNQIAILSDIQCSFLEQEVNWGPNDFQLRTNFGCPSLETNLKHAVPRDFFMLFFEAMSEELNKGKTLDQSFTDIIQPHLSNSFEARNTVIFPPTKGSRPKVKIDQKFSTIFESLMSKKPEPWINPFLERIKTLCEKSGTSPYFRG